MSRATIIGLVVIVLVQAIVIAVLLFERRVRRRAQIALSESEERSEIVGVSLGVGFWTWEPDRDRIWTSTVRVAPRLEGCRGTDARSVPQCARIEDRRIRPKRVRACGEKPEVVRREWPVAHHDEAVRWIAAATCPSIDARGRRHVTGVLMDVTGRKNGELVAAEQRRELSHLSRVAMLGEMSGALAHELKRPLTAIHNYAQGARRFIERERPDLEKVRESLDAIVKSETHAGRVIDRVGVE